MLNIIRACCLVKYVKNNIIAEVPECRDWVSTAEIVSVKTTYASVLRKSVCEIVLF